MSAGVKINSIGKFDLNPRGNLWFKDESTFGHKLLSKMGWSKGKGLGKNEDGIKENLKVKVKAKNTGIGWTEKFPLSQETAAYDAVLANLNKQFNNSSNSKSENETTSIEKRSQQFKKRLHYGKFVRGKDVGRYSEKDFNSIFVTKMPKSEPKVEMESSVTNLESPSENQDGTITYKSSLSMKEYFEMKMKKKPETCTSITVSDIQKVDETAQNEFPSKKKSKKKKQKLNSEEPTCEDIQVISPKSIEDKDNVEEHTLKRKRPKKGLEKSKKIKLEQEAESSNDSTESNEDVVQICEVTSLENGTNKRKERKKHLTASDEANNVSSSDSTTSDEDVTLISECEMLENNANKKLKKKKTLKNSSKTASEKSSNTTAEHNEINLNASDCKILSEDDISIIVDQNKESQEVVDRTVKKRKRKKKAKNIKLENNLSDDSTSSSCSANETVVNVEESSANSEEQSAKRKKLKAKRSKKPSSSLLKGLKTCLKSVQTSYSVEKESRRVSFSEQVFCRLLTTHEEEEGETEVKSEINDIVIPCVNDESGVSKEVEEVVDLLKTPAKNEEGREEKKEIVSSDDSDSERTLSVEEEDDDGTTPNCMDLPKSENSNYNQWLENQRIASKMKLYKTMVKKLKKNPVLKTTNLLDIKGYGNWGF